MSHERPDLVPGPGSGEPTWRGSVAGGKTFRYTDTRNLFLRAQMGYVLHPPALQFAVLAACGLMLSFAIILSTFPVLRRITGSQTARNE